MTIKDIRLLYFLVATAYCQMLFACQKKPNQIDWDILEQKFSSDSLKFEAVKFLKQSLDPIHSEQLVFLNQESGHIIDVRLDTISSEESLISIVQRDKLKIVRRKVLDRELLNTQAIDNIISDAFELRERYAWSRDVPDSLFLNFVLPYKVAAEYPRDWRGYFRDRFGKQLDSLNLIEGFNAQDVTRFLVNEIEKSYLYDEDNYLNSAFPDLHELLYSSKGECYRIAFLYTYMLRAAGIPSVVDIVPVWGSKNAGHAEYVSLDSTGKLISNVATEHKKVLERAAKVFRLSFQNKGTYSSSIQPYIGDYPFLIPYLKHDYIQDVTDEHTNCFEISYQLPFDLSGTPFAYICAYNFGKWGPVFWGPNIAGDVNFSMMNSNILYQVGIPSKDGMMLLGNVFYLDSLGVRHDVGEPHHTYSGAKLSKINSGEKSYLKPNQTYDLQELKVDGSWQSIGNLSSNEYATLTLERIGFPAFYRLIGDQSDERFARPFRYSRSGLEWW